jgi:soluble lytic murein transglycosylase-like protein
MVSMPEAKTLGLAPARVALVRAPKVSLDTLKADVHQALGASAKVSVTRPLQVDQSLSSAYAQANVPAYYLALYRRAAVTCPGLPWTVLAGIGTVETGNGRDVHKSSAGAEGPMQFLPSTWAMYGYDADGDGKANINDPVDAVFSAARYLCAAGASRGGQSLNDAIFSYNHAWWYVREVVNLANEYA